MTIRHLPARERRAQPWKNGGGVTREIAVEPPGADMDGFAWRVSTAEVASDGPFSRFEGVDRNLTILDGDGMSLSIGDDPPVELRADGDPLAFAADVPTTAALLGGTVNDLNVMVRRGAWTARVTRAAAPAGVRCETDACLVFMTAAGAADGGSLERLDALLLERGDAAALEAGEAVVVELRRL